MTTLLLKNIFFFTIFSNKKHLCTLLQILSKIYYIWFYSNPKELIKPNPTDIKIAKIIKTLRKLRGVKQFHLAQILKIRECSYCKLENAYTAFTTGQVKEIADYLKINWKLIFCLAEHHLEVKENGHSKTVINQLTLINELEYDNGFNPDELGELLSKIKNFKFD
jgi:transcriptional regulator with XRE-family HTH domain